jgi:hypothetical protein
MSSVRRYCICKKKKGGPTIECARKEECTRHKIYHVSCINVENQDITDGTWHCCEDCELWQEDDDAILEHSLQILYELILLSVNHDIVREGDGEGMMMMWRIHMLQFWNYNHYKYFISGHSLLAKTAGFETERLQKELTWERVVNLKGVAGGNIGLDLLNEFINCDFKEMLKRSRGRYTSAQTCRVGILSGEFGRSIDGEVQRAMGMAAGDTIRKKKPAYKEDIQKFITAVHPEGVFQYCPVRNHKSFPNVKRSDFSNVKSPDKLGGHVKKLSSDLDFWRRRSLHLARRLPVD